MDIAGKSDSDAPEVLDGVKLAQLAAGDRMSVQHFNIDPGALVVDHSHEHEQAGYSSVVNSSSSSKAKSTP